MDAFPMDEVHCLAMEAQSFPGAGLVRPGFPQPALQLRPGFPLSAAMMRPAGTMDIHGSGWIMTGWEHE